MMKGTNDTQILIGLITFLVALAFISAQFGTEIISAREGWDPQYNSNATTFGEETVIIPEPPTCGEIIQGIPILSEIVNSGSCVVNFMGWLLSLMTVKSQVQWIYTLILLPIFATIVFLVVRLARSGGG